MKDSGVKDHRKGGEGRFNYLERKYVLNLEFKNTSHAISTTLVFDSFHNEDLRNIEQ